MITRAQAAANRPGVYLAGDMVFRPQPDAMFDRMKQICARHGLRGLAPADNQIGLEGHQPGKALIGRIVRADIDTMERAEAAVFCLDGFRRGPDMDPGTAMEVGYMVKSGKKLAGWTSDTRLYARRVEDHFQTTYGQACTVAAPNAAGGTSGTERDPDGVLIHSEECYQNGMVEIGIEQSGGKVFAHPDWQVAFGHAVQHVSRQLQEAL